MDFGKIKSLKSLEKISFSLPLRDERSHYVQKTGLEATRVFLGCPVWGKKEWIGNLYPSRTSKKDFLKFYSEQLNSVELNSTFYGIPEIETVEKWRDTVPSDFLFCPKFFQGISRFEVLTEIKELTRRFLEAIQRFDKNLGMSLLQLPPSFGPNKLLILKRFLLLLPKNFSTAVEFRHSDWFSHGRLIEPAFNLLNHFGVTTAVTDAVGRPDVLHQSLTTPKVFIRFLGNGLHPSDFLRIRLWVERIEEWSEAGLKEIYFFMHQPEEGGTLELIQYFSENLSKNTTIRFRGPDFQKGALGQQELF